MNAHDSTETDWMTGHPPAPDKVIRFGDGSFYQWPQLRWSFNHMEQLVPTKVAWRGPGASRILELGDFDFVEQDVALADGTTLSWQEMLSSSDTDGLAVLHHGKLVYEHYRNEAGPHTPHLLMSCNKSLVGTITELLIEEGQLDENALVPTVLAELQDSAWGDATIRQVMDMVVAMEFDENYLDPSSDVWTFIRSTGMIPTGPTNALTLAEFLPTIQKEGVHGEVFAYREPNIFVLGWIVRRVTGRGLNDLASDLIWQHIGAEHDYLFMVDSVGGETTASATLRDFLRFGLLFTNQGRIGGKQVLPPQVIDSILAGGSREVFARGDYANLPDWSYRSQWWYRHVGGRCCPVARGAHGQMLYIDPEQDLVIARFGSSPEAPSSLLDHILLPMVDNITEQLS